MNNILRYLLISLCLVVCYTSSLQAENYIRLKGNYGNNADVSNIKTDASPVTGLGLDYEFKLTSDAASFWNYPYFGLSLGAIDFNGSEEFGTNTFFYPYILFSSDADQLFSGGIKLGLGVSYFSQVGQINGMHFVPVAALGAVLNLRLDDQISLTGELNSHLYNNMNWNEASQSVATIYGSLGVRFQLKPIHKRRGYCYIADDPVQAQFSISALASYTDYSPIDDNPIPNASLHADFQWRVRQVYQTGGGLTLFYNDKYQQQGQRGTEDYTNAKIFNKYFIPEESISNKLKVGVEWNNTFLFSRVAFLMDMGIMIYDPIKDAYKEETSRGIIYTYDYEKEEGWFYGRLGLRYRVTNFWNAQLYVTTFAGMIDAMQFGVSYVIPFTQQFTYTSRRSSKRRLHVFHYDDD